jgi:hypothetical protein
MDLQQISEALANFWDWLVTDHFGVCLWLFPALGLGIVWGLFAIEKGICHC